MTLIMTIYMLILLCICWSAARSRIGRYLEELTKPVPQTSSTTSGLMNITMCRCSKIERLGLWIPYGMRSIAACATKTERRRHFVVLENARIKLLGLRRSENSEILNVPIVVASICIFCWIFSIGERSCHLNRRFRAPSQGLIKLFHFCKQSTVVAIDLYWKHI